MTVSRRVVLAVLAPLILGAAPVTRPYTLEGRLTDRASSAPIEGATVSLVGARRSVLTDAQGDFVFRGLQLNGADEIVVTHAEYRPTRLAMGALPDGAWRLEVSLTKEAVALGDGIPEEPVSR